MSTVSVAIHATQFPESVTRDLLQSLRAREINHKFLYESYKQSRKWLAVHEAHSPWKNDPNLVAAYDAAFAGMLRRIQSSPVRVIGLGCGSGQKDARLLKTLGMGRLQVSYLPVDVSVGLVLTAGKAAAEALVTCPLELRNENCSGLVCDLASADDLSAVFDQQAPPNVVRLFTFFGMLPNFEPEMILPKLRAFVRSGDLLLLSANLAPGDDYEAGTHRILPQYDNALTRDWLLTFLLDLGLERNDGEIVWSVERICRGADLFRVTANFRFKQSRTLKIGDETFAFGPGESIRLFFSYRYTPDKLGVLLATQGVTIAERWIANSQEEGIFLCTFAE